MSHAEGVLLPSDADERIWDYFATASIPDPQTAEKVLNSLGGDALAEVKVETSFKLNRQTAQAWVDADFAKPGSGRR